MAGSRLFFSYFFIFTARYRAEKAVHETAKAGNVRSARPYMPPAPSSSLSQHAEMALHVHAHVTAQRRHRNSRRSTAIVYSLSSFTATRLRGVGESCSLSEGMLLHIVSSSRPPTLLHQVPPSQHSGHDVRCCAFVQRLLFLK